MLCGHLYVVIIDVLDSLDHVIVTYLTSKKSHSDLTVILSRNDHNFIKHDTVVKYADAKIMRREDIVVRVKDRIYEAHEKFTPNTTSRIQHGLLASPHTPNNIKKVYAAHLNNQRRI